MLIILSIYKQIIIVLAVEIGSDLNSVRILSVSTIIDQENAQRVGSMQGGTRLYIKIVGHDSHMASNNQIFVGPYKCEIPEMGVEVFISCITTPAYDLTQISNLPVVVKTIERSDSQCAQNDSKLCTFSYDNNKTPILDAIIPNQITADQNVLWWGKFKVTNTKQIQKMLIGKLLCDRFHLGLNEDSNFSGSDYNNLECQIHKQHLAGFYRSQFLSDPGKAIKRSKLTQVRSTTLDTPYEIQVSSTQYGNRTEQSVSSQGGFIRISATGIPSNGINTTFDYLGTPVTFSQQYDDYFEVLLPQNLKNAQVDNSKLQYVSGSGVRQQIFKTDSWYIDDLIKVYNNKVDTLELIEDKVVPSTEYMFKTQEQGLGRKFIVFSGYFNPPRDGSYAFQTSSDYHAKFFFQINGESTDQSTMTLINQITDDTLLRMPYSEKYDQQQSTSDKILLNLQKGKSYYFKIFAISYSENYFHLNVGVRVPSGNSNKYPNSVGQVTRIRIDYNFTKEVITIQHKDKDTKIISNFQINFIDPFGAKSKESAKVWKTTTTQFTKDSSCSSISYHFKYYNAGNTCSQMDILDAKGQKIGQIWTLTFTERRNSIKPTFVYNKTLADAPIYNLITQQGQQLSGTFRMKINGQYVQINKSSDIPFNISHNTLCQQLQQILGTNDLDSSQKYDYVDGAHWIFDFYGISNTILVEVIESESKLISENNKAKPVAENLREAGDYLYYPAIENELLTQHDSKPHLLIKVNGVLTLASIQNKQTIITIESDENSFSFAGFSDDEVNQKLSITGVTTGNTINVVQAGFSAFYNNVQMQIESWDGSTLIASYPYKVAGNYKPQVHYFGKGFSLSSASSKQTSPIITSLSSNTIYSFGGTEIKILGKYFPTQNNSDLIVTIGQKKVKILTISNTSITILTPNGLSAGIQNLVVTYKNISSDPQSIIVDDNDAITLISIDQKIISPVDKTLIQVTGTNFGTDQKTLEACLDELDSSENTVNSCKYKVNIVKAENTSLQILFGGGIPGIYRLKIIQKGKGCNIPTSNGVDIIQYNIIISSFSRQTTSKYGGAKLIINGRNFSPIKTDNQVFIESELCLITTSSSTIIECILPNMSAQFPQKVTEAVFNIEIWGKLIAQAIIDPDSKPVPKITYKESEALSISSISNQQQVYDSEYQINGSGIPTNSGDIKVVIIGNEDVEISFYSVTATYVKYVAPNLPVGSYQIVIRGQHGDSNPININIQESINLLDDYNVSASGQEITVKVSGCLKEQDPIFKFNNLVAQVLSYNYKNGQVVIRLPTTSTGKGIKLLSLRSSQISLNSNGNLPWITHSKTFTVVSSTWSVTNIAVSNTDITITGSGINTLVSAYLQDPNQPKSTKIIHTSISEQTQSSAKISFSGATAGTYNIYLLNNKNAYPSISNSNVQINLPDLTTTQILSSFAGGQQVTINGSKFNTIDFKNNIVTICGNQADVISADANSLIVLTPPAYTQKSLLKYNFPSDSYNSLNGFKTFGNDPNGNFNYIGDGDLLFYYSSSVVEECFVGLDFGKTKIILNKFELFPRSQGVSDASVFFGSKFQASNDNITWIDLLEIETDFHLGKNVYLIDSLYTKSKQDSKYKQAYSYFRIYDQIGNSKCELAEIKIYGWKSSNVVENGNTLTCPIQVSVNNSNIKEVNQNVIYDTTNTYIVQQVNPSYGDIRGGTDITIQLDKPVSGNIAVIIDGFACTNISSSDSIITCKTAVKTDSKAPSLIVTINSYQAVNNGILFYYGNLWSQDATWGNDFSPIDGDLVLVNDGRTLIVDVPYIGVLNTLILENANLIFADDMDIHFEANNILVRNGKVIIGTELAPINGQIRITMHGNEEDKQFPTVGNKGFSLHNSSIDIHGKKRPVTWTELQQTANIGDNSITVKLKNPGFDWTIGDEIVIASTDFSHGHAERRIIKSITPNINTNTAIITFDKKLLVKHVSLSENYKGKTIQMIAEVGLLTRNVIFEGDESSVAKQYGAHMMLHGAYTSARIRYAEFTRTGQPTIIGRYPIHFHMVGDVSGSIVEGNAIHDSFARVLTIHATHYLQVRNNVGYNCAGHNIFLEDGIETNNLIEDNLILGTKQVWSMLQSDITAASYWITNPLNYINRNRAGGGDFYGFWYEIKENPDGPSSRNDICPQGMGLGSFDGNIAHSYDRFGLRIFVLTNLKYPCQSHRNDKNENPFLKNPSFEIKFQNFIAFRNHEDGVLAEDVGNMIFDNFALIDNKQSGFNIYKTNRTDEEVVLRNSIIVGKSYGNAASDGELVSTRGLITPRTDGFRVENVHFENFEKDMTVFKSCSGCWNFMLWVLGGKLTRFKQISYLNVNSKKMFWEKWKREIYEDMDGTLTGKSESRWISPSGVHLMNQPECSTTSKDQTDWDNAVICSRQIVKIEFSSPEKLDLFSSKALYIQPTDTNNVPIQQDSNKLQDSDFYISKSIIVMNGDFDNGFVGTFLVGKLYSIQWEISAIDFTHMTVNLSPYQKGSSPDDTIILRFPYSEFRETFDIGQMIAQKNIKFYKNVTLDQSSGPLATLKSRSCQHGDWYNDISGKALYLCLNDNNRPKATQNQYLERTDINALKCKKNCPLPPGKCIKDNLPRKLSDITTWKNIVEDGITYNLDGAEELLIPCPWEILIDIDIVNFKRIVIQGTLRIDPSKDINIKAYGIFIKGGSIIAEGLTEGSAYTKKLNFELLGEKSTSTQFLIDDGIEVGNKVIVNTGKFILRGSPPDTTSTRLTASLNPGENIITVSSSSGWVVGDKIAIAPTQLDGTQNEEFIIQNINGQTITLNDKAKYYHFGATTVTISESWDQYTQNLDLRAQVLHLTRNIKISGSQVNNNIQWGCRVLNYFWKNVADENGNTLDPLKQLLLRGTVDWNGVEMDYCGQADTIRGGIDFQKCGADQEKVVSLIQNSAIHNCPGYCSNIEESAYIKIQNTNFYKGRPILLRIYDVNNVSITGNHFVAALKRDYSYNLENMVYDMNASIYFYSMQDIIADSILISNNVVQGSEGPCLVLPHLSCEAVDKQTSSVGIFGNQAQTCLIGVMYKATLQTCQFAGKIGVARATRGMIMNPARPGIVVQHVLAAESEISVVLRFGSTEYRNVGKFTDSSIYAVAVTGSSDAYNNSQKAKVCQNGVGVQNLVVTVIGEEIPLRVQPVSFDVICTQQAFDATLYQVNVKYVRFKKTYTDSNLSLCGNNFMMRTHGGASDATAGTYNRDVTCQECNEEAYFDFLSASPGWAGWFGGCGTFSCTAPDNVLNVDFSGTLFNGKPTTAISHNDGIITSSCKKQPNWNQAYSCDGINYVQIEWEVQGPDFNTKQYAPVMVTSLDGTYSNKINMSKEWMWDGSEPMNKRENRFVASVIVNTIYNVQYTGLTPFKLLHRIQTRTFDGEPKIWVIYTVTYKLSLNVDVSIDGGVTPKQYIPSDNIDLTKLTDLCGANIFNYETKTIQFIMNGSNDCVVRTEVLDTVRINLKVNLKTEDFFKEDNKLSFLSKIAAFLQIKDYSRIKIVGTKQGSRFLQNSGTPSSSFELIIDITNKPSDSNNKDSSAIFKDLSDKANKLKSGLESNNIPGLSPNTYSVTNLDVMVASDTSGSIFGKNSQSNNNKNNNEDDPIVVESSEKDNSLKIVLGIVISIIVVIIVIVAVCGYKKYKQRNSILFAHQADCQQLPQSPQNTPRGKQISKIYPVALNPDVEVLEEKDCVADDYAFDH